MTDIALLGPWVRRFLLEHLVGERNLARNTQRSYRDTLAAALALCRDARPQGGSTGSGSRTSRPIGFGPSCGKWKRSGAVAWRRATSVWRRSIPWRTSSACAARSMSRGAGKSVPSRSRSAPPAGELPGEGGDGRPAGGAGCGHGPGSPGPCRAAVPVQHRRSRRRGGPRADR